MNNTMNLKEVESASVLVDYFAVRDLSLKLNFSFYLIFILEFKNGKLASENVIYY